jgi:hypothetical protein
MTVLRQALETEAGRMAENATRAARIGKFGTEGGGEQ